MNIIKSFLERMSKEAVVAYYNTKSQLLLEGHPAALRCISEMGVLDTHGSVTLGDDHFDS
jgi:hypothetical protein